MVQTAFGLSDQVNITRAVQQQKLARGLIFQIIINSDEWQKELQQANLENLCPPPRFFLKNTESSENVKFIGGVTLTRYILFT